MKAQGDQQIQPGILLIDKPRGPTSFFVVRQVRRILGIKKVGHAGTLDPFASGLLVICVGRPATRLSETLMNGTKQYVATLQLGVETDTQDPEGRVIATTAVPQLDVTEINDCLRGFLGRQLQVPPQFSALKHKGKPLYYYARRGIVVEKEAREITIQKIDLKDYTPAKAQLTVTIVCSRGTYIRTLAADIGRALGCGAHLAALRRLRSGTFSVEESFPGGRLEQARAAELADAMLPVFQVQEMLTEKV